MRSTHKTITRIAAWAIGILKSILRRLGIEGVFMAKVIEFYIPTSFRKPTKWVPAVERGKIIEFCPQLKKPA